MVASHHLTPDEKRLIELSQKRGKPVSAVLIEETRERRRRLSARAVPDKPIPCLSASARAETFVPPDLPPPPPPPCVEQWVERQVSMYKPWFSIVDASEAPNPVRPSINLIQRVCCDHYSVTMAALLSPQRHEKIVRARQVAMFLAKELTTRSMPEIGRRFGGRDHTTVLHGVRKIAKLESESKALADELEDLRQRILEGS